MNFIYTIPPLKNGDKEPYLQNKESYFVKRPLNGSIASCYGNFYKQLELISRRNKANWQKEGF